jgi:peroxiredoxin Q/BCP
MKPLFSTTTALLSLMLATPACANLAVGDQAPNFSAQGVQSETPMAVNLSELLKKGPVVLFFFPSVFVGNSAAECHDFANSIDKFRAAGATVVGMSRDSIDALGRFSTEECAGKFPMASADMDVVTGFDVNDSANFTTRTTYVINPSGKIAFADDGDVDNNHVQHALAFVQGMKN